MNADINNPLLNPVFEMPPVKKIGSLLEDDGLGHHPTTPPAKGIPLNEKTHEKLVNAGIATAKERSYTGFPDKKKSKPDRGTGYSQKKKKKR